MPFDWKKINRKRLTTCDVFRFFQEVSEEQQEMCERFDKIEQKIDQLSQQLSELLREK